MCSSQQKEVVTAELKAESGIWSAVILLISDKLISYLCFLFTNMYKLCENNKK